MSEMFVGCALIRDVLRLCVSDVLGLTLSGSEDTVAARDFASNALRTHGRTPGWPDMDVKSTVLSVTLQDMNANCTEQNTFSGKCLSIKMVERFSYLLQDQKFRCRIHKISLLVSLLNTISSIHNNSANSCLFFSGKFANS
jgi:hypothetical protein